MLLTFGVVAVALFAIPSSMAQSRGRKPVLWGVFGALLHLIALLAILTAGKSDDVV